MYEQFFRLSQSPFSIAPDPRYLFMSERHREALAHLLFGVGSGGGIVLLTGDIGTGKTTICRCFLEQVPANCTVAYIFNPKLTAGELLQTICEEFHIALPPREHGAAGAKDCIDALNRYLLVSHAQGRNNVLIIDEAQNLAADVLEQLRLLTNLETNERKLLQIILIGQPELRAMLARPELEQLAQRVIAHYHLSALSEQETASYIQHRLATAGLSAASPFQPALMKPIHRFSGGVPRRINLLCDRALLGAYASNTHTIDRAIVNQAAAELFVQPRRRSSATNGRRRWAGAVAAIAVTAGAAWAAVEGGWLHDIRQRWPGIDAEAHGAMQDVQPAAPRPEAAAAGLTALPAAMPADAAPQPVSAIAAIETTKPEPEFVLRHGTLTEQQALQQLLRLWQAAPPAGDPCAAAAPLRCHKSSGGLAELIRLDRPALLTLYDAAGKPSYAVLTGLDESHAVLDNGTTRQAVALTALARHFRGEFVTLWRAPPGFAGPVQLGDRGPAADWVAAQLAKLYDTPPPAPGQPFGLTAQKQVRQLQQAHGLFVDGIVGPATAMQISRATISDEPRLRTGASAKE